MKKIRIFIMSLSIAFLFCDFSTSFAQPIGKAKNSDTVVEMGSRYVPENAFAMLAFSPTELLQNPAIEWFPVEVLRVYSKEQFGIDSQSVTSVKAVWGLSDVGELQFGMIMQLADEINLETLLTTLNADLEPTSVDNRLVYFINGPEEVLHMIDPRTLYVGMTSYLSPMIQAGAESGPLPLMVKSLPASPGINALIAMESIRPIVSDVAMQGSAALAPDLQSLARLPELTDTVQLNVNTDGDSIGLKVTFTGVNEGAAASIESTIKDSILAAQRLAIAEVERSMETEENSAEMLAASLRYAERLSAQFIQMLTPEREGKDVTLAVESKLGFTGTSILAGLLVPAMQSAHLASMRTNVSINMKQVLLGLHNFHAAYNKLPPPAITDADGKPLLSWRVALLPFLDEQQLYQEFHLDEPWDSEHNLPLSKRLPALYAMPGVRLAAGETVIHAIVGETIGVHPKNKTTFREFLDGLSNTALIVQVSADSAVPWSKPDDVKIDFADPLANFVGNPKKGFHIGMGDGTVRFLSDNVAIKLFQALLTRAGREVIDLDAIK